MDGIAKDTQPQESATQPLRYTIFYGGSLYGLAAFGAANFLERHPRIRLLAGSVGVLVTISGIFGVVGLKLPDPYTGINPGILFVVGVFFIYLATVSGPQFSRELKLGPRRETVMRQKAEEEFARSSTPESAVNLDLKRLNEYYVINQSQARSSFYWAIASMTCGFLTIIGGIWLFLLRPEQHDALGATLTTIGGSVVNVVGTTFLLLQSRTQKQSLYYYKQLVAMQKLSMAIRLVEGQSDSSQSGTRDFLIQDLLSLARDIATAPIDK